MQIRLVYFSQNVAKLLSWGETLGNDTNNIRVSDFVEKLEHCI